MIGYRIIRISLRSLEHVAEGRAHFDRAIALYDPAERRPLATRFGADSGVQSVLSVARAVVTRLS